MIEPSLEYYGLSRQKRITTLAAPKSKAKLECGSLMNKVVKKRDCSAGKISILERQTLPDETYHLVL